MELQNNIFDEFKAAADGEEEAPFKEQLWERIESRLDEEPEQRRAFVPWVKYMAASVVLLVGTGIVWQLSREENTVPATEVAQHTAQPQPAAVPVTDPDRTDTARTTPEQTALAVSPKVQVKQYSIKPLKENTGKQEAIPHGADNTPVLAHTKVTDSIPVLAQTPVPAEKTKSMITAEPASNKSFLFNSVVTDASMEVIPGAIVELKGTNKAVLSDDEGKFAIQVPDSNAILIVRSFGAETKEVAVNRLNSKWITLGYGSTAMDEVTVYGTKLDPKTYVGSVTTVTAKEIAKTPVSSGFRS